MYPHKAVRQLFSPLDIYGADARNRTADLLITNQLLYRLSYIGFSVNDVSSARRYFRATCSDIYIIIVSMSRF
jgi:hypothetical protein